MSLPHAAVLRNRRDRANHDSIKLTELPKAPSKGRLIFSLTPTTRTIPPPPTARGPSCH